MVKRAENLYLEAGKWGIIGGFVERGETIREAAAREVFEETGYRIKNLDLLTIRDNPDRPGEDRQNISFVFSCEAGEKEGVPDNESTEQRWFDLNAIPDRKDIAFDHYENIQKYIQDSKNENTKKNINILLLGMLPILLFLTYLITLPIFAMAQEQKFQKCIHSLKPGEACKSTGPWEIQKIRLQP